MKPDYIIDVNNLKWKYYDREILHSISMGFERGSFNGIIGPNGSGKTTLLKLIIKLLTPEAKTILIDKRDVLSYHRKQLAKKNAYVPQSQQFGLDFTVDQIVMMGRTPHQGRFDCESKKDRGISEQAMKQAKIYHLKDKLITHISGGEVQRVIIARALAQEPKILLLDEPFSNLDPALKKELKKSLIKLQKKFKITVVYVTHNIDEISDIANKIITMKNGKIMQTGKTKK